MQGQRSKPPGLRALVCLCGVQIGDLRVSPGSSFPFKLQLAPVAPCSRFR